jgi:Transposase DDE domain
VPSTLPEHHEWPLQCAPGRIFDWLARNDRIDWSRAVVDSCSIRAVYGGDQTGPNPTDRAKRGSKRHLICDRQGVPLAVRLTGANRNDSQEALALVDAIPPLQAERGRPRRRPVCVLGDRGYDAAAIRHGLRSRHILPARDAPYQERQRLGPVALGCRADVCVAESISSLACPLRETVRHPSSIPLARLYVDLLAVAAQGLDDGLNPDVGLIPGNPAPPRRSTSRRTASDS